MSEFYEDDDGILPQIRRQGRTRFDFLGGCFKDKKIAPTDIDNMFEHRGRFFVFEFKQPGEAMPQGQEIALRKLLELNDRKMTIMEVEGIPPDEVHRYRWLAHGGLWAPSNWMTGDAYVVRELVRHWWKWIDQQHGESLKVSR